jgi:thioredoxin-dependent peroxiredoxin
MEGTGTVVGKPAPDFALADADANTVRLSDACKKGPVLLVFYPGDFTMVCTKQLCNYRDKLSDFSEFGVQIIGISHNPSKDHKKFGEKYAFPFPLLTDPGREVAKRFGCASPWMLGKPSRSVFIINSKQVTLYKYVEPTTLTYRSGPELVGILKDLKKAKLI